jgi:acetylornithine deacetylase/succinyl-diaminopimelate desuccinylase-like protein
MYNWHSDNAVQEDGWDTDPFVLTEVDGKLYGRGSTDDKGPVLGWIHAIEAFQQTGQDLPVNLKVRFLQLISTLFIHQNWQCFFFFIFP